MSRRRAVRASVMATLALVSSFILLSLGSLLAPWPFERLGWNTLARHVDDPLMLIPFALLSAAAACGVFWDSYHRSGGA